MRKMRCVFSAALLAVAAAVAVPAMAADAPAGPPAWTTWWQDLSAWVGRLSPVTDRAVAASSDGTVTTSGDDESAPPVDDGSDFEIILFGGGEHDESGPHWDPNGGK